MGWTSQSASRHVAGSCGRPKEADLKAGSQARLPTHPAGYMTRLEAIKERFFSTGDAGEAVRLRSDAVDEAAISLFDAQFGKPSGLALLAVGGYGRRQLFPYSDVDLLLLLEKQGVPGSTREKISAFLSELWDGGMRPSHSVRTPSECTSIAAGNSELNVSLLDARYLAGDRLLYERLAERLPAFHTRERDALTRVLGQLTRDRHSRYGNTIYHLEPDIKEAPGGVRDLHLIGWLSQLGGIEPQNCREELSEAQRFLFSVRCHLHYFNERDNNVLTFEHQQRTAVDNPADWMREYYRNVRTVHRRAARMLEETTTPQHSLFTPFRDGKSRLSNPDFAVTRGLLYVRRPEVLEREPELVLRLFEFIARHGIPAAPETERRLAKAVPGFRTTGPLWPSVAAILRLPHAYKALGTMRETGMMSRIFPEFDRIDCLVVHDFYHRYTVDEHSLRTIKTLCELGGKDDPLTHPFAELMEETERPEVLMFALLFHDVGGSGEDHVAEGLNVAEMAMTRIEMPEPEREMVRFLIQHHLEMSSTMTRRDLADPATVWAFAERVSTLERLRKLTLMTYADISAVNPEALSPWRKDLLWQLYVATHNRLTREMEEDRIDTGPPFLRGLPTRYTRTHTPAQIAEHAKLEKTYHQKSVAISLARRHSLYELVVLANERPLLFASIAGAISSFAMNILKAEAFSNVSGMVLGTFVFEDPSRSLELIQGETDRLRATLERVVIEKIDVGELLQKRPPPPSFRRPDVPLQVAFDNETSANDTIYHVIAEDRPGLLYDLASTFSFNRCNIEVVLIDTEANKAVDVFYVRSEGRKLDNERAQRLCGELERACESG